MSKFLRTIQKIDGINQKVVVQVESCHHCPLMKFHVQQCLATCRVFSNEQTNTVDDFVLNYNVTTGQIYDTIEIPKWCRLPDERSQIDFDNKTYVIYEDKVMTSNTVPDPDLPLYKPSDIDGEIDLSKVEDDELGIMEILPALVAASVFAPNTNTDRDCAFPISADEAYERAYDKYDNFGDHGGFSEIISTPSRKINKYGTCSLCGEEDDTVNRNTNYGMCDSCWKASYKDDKRKRQAFINNFRLKRGKDFQMDNFKLLTV